MNIEIIRQNKFSVHWIMEQASIWLIDQKEKKEKKRKTIFEYIFAIKKKLVLLNDVPLT